MKNILRAFVTDDHGRVAVSQWPNTPLLVWLFCVVLARIWSAGTPHLLLHWVGTIALVVWAAWELLDGASYFRRSLGFVVLVWTSYHIFW